MSLTLPGPLRGCVDKTIATANPELSNVPKNFSEPLPMSQRMLELSEVKFYDFAGLHSHLEYSHGRIPYHPPRWNLPSRLAPAAPGRHGDLNRPLRPCGLEVF